MKQQREFWLAFSLGLILGCPAGTFAQSTGCAGREREAALPTDSKVYRDAMTLSGNLRKNGILVDCIMSSKMEATFDGQSGAVAYRSDRGSFEVLFLPKAETFDHLNIIEQTNGDRYSYRFNGHPQPWPANLIDSAHRIYFVKNRNTLFVVDDDATLAATLQRFVRSQQP